MKNRQELAKHFAQLNFKVGAEIGVCKGYYSKTLFESIPGLKLYGIDNWSVNSSSHSGRNKNDLAYKETLGNLKTYIGSGQFIIVRKTSMEALADIPDESLDFVFIDADHTYEAVKEDINGWTPKVRFGGIVSGHDYYEFGSGRGGIIPAVNEYIQENEYSLQLTSWDKENPDRDSRQPNWFFVK